MEWRRYETKGEDFPKNKAWIMNIEYPMKNIEIRYSIFIIRYSVSCSSRPSAGHVRPVADEGSLPGG